MRHRFCARTRRQRRAAPRRRVPPTASGRRRRRAVAAAKDATKNASVPATTAMSVPTESVAHAAPATARETSRARTIGPIGNDQGRCKSDREDERGHAGDEDRDTVGDRGADRVQARDQRERQPEVDDRRDQPGDDDEAHAREREQDALADAQHRLDQQRREHHQQHRTCVGVVLAVGQPQQRRPGHRDTGDERQRRQNEQPHRTPEAAPDALVLAGADEVRDRRHGHGLDGLGQLGEPRDRGEGDRVEGDLGVRGVVLEHEQLRAPPDDELDDHDDRGRADEAQVAPPQLRGHRIARRQVADQPARELRAPDQVREHRDGLEAEEPGDADVELEHDDRQRHRGDAGHEAGHRALAPALRAREQAGRHGLHDRERAADAGQDPGRARVAAEQRDDDERGCHQRRGHPFDA